MLSPQDNALVTQVGPGTPCGELMRRYWMPICPEAEITDAKPKKRVRMLGEDLVLFRDAAGRYGLLPEHCPHRHVSLYFGFVEPDGIRCPYHGWKFDVAGKCVEQPFEPANSPLKDEACRRSYPVQSLAGILFAYLGPEPAPLLPRWETMVREDGTRKIVVLPVHRCNWLQAQENSLDPVHTFYLHAHMLKQTRKDGAFAESIAYFSRPIEGIDFELCVEPAWAGIRKIRTYGGEKGGTEAGHPAVFPNILVAPQGKELVMHWRVPVDDQTTYILWLEFTPTRDGADAGQADADIPVTYLLHPLGPDGEYDLSDFPGQDLMAWETQGRIFDRSTELLGTTDRGVVMMRRLLIEQIKAVGQGKEPVGVIRDPACNQQINFKNIDRTTVERSRKYAPAK